MVADKSAYLIAHRGASKEAPENTLPAFHRAIELGASYLELDVQLTAEGEVVVFHDATLERTTDSGTALVDSTALAHLQSLDAGSWFSRDHAQERVPLLEEVIALNHPLMVELKGKDLAIVEKTVTLCEGADCVIGSLEKQFMEELVKRLPKERLIAIVDDEKCIPRYLDLGLGLFGLDDKVVTREWVAVCPTVWVWTVDDPVRAQELLSWGVSGLITNDPKRLDSVVKFFTSKHEASDMNGCEE